MPKYTQGPTGLLKDGTVRIYKGYFNYKPLSGHDKGRLKTHNFRELTKAEVDKLRQGFKNQHFELVGEVVVRET